MNANKGLRFWNLEWKHQRFLSSPFSKQHLYMEVDRVCYNRLAVVNGKILIREEDGWQVDNATHGHFYCSKERSSCVER